MKKAVLISIALTLAVLVLGELVARLLWEDRNSVEVTAANAAFAYHPWSVHRMTPGFTFKKMSINRRGWRGPEVEKRKPAGTRRLILLGASVAFSSYHIGHEATIAGQLERLLSESTGERWQLLNLAVPGGNAAMSLVTLATEGIHFEPDVVVALDGNNELYVLTNGELPPVAAAKVYAGYGLFPTVSWKALNVTISKLYDPRLGNGGVGANLSMILAHSSLLRLLRTAFVEGERKAWPETVARAERLDFFIESQIATHYLARGTGAVFIHFIQPYLSISSKTISERERAAIEAKEASVGLSFFEFLDAGFPVLRRKMRAAAATHGFKTVDLSLLLNDYDVFSDHVHFMPASASYDPANYLVAREIAKAVLSSLGYAARLPSIEEEVAERKIPGLPPRAAGSSGGV